MFNRVAAGCVAAVCGACGINSAAPALAIDSIQPASGVNDMPVAVDIRGSFHRPVQINFDTGQATTAVPTATLVGGSLDSVQWQSEQRIAASVPAGLTAGLY